MIRFIKKLLFGEPTPEPPRAVRAIGERRARPRPIEQPKPPQAVKREPVDVETKVEGRIESVGPGKNVLVQNDYQRENTGVQELSLVGESEDEVDTTGGIDPYNTGRFDRSKHWDKRFRK